VRGHEPVMKLRSGLRTFSGKSLFELGQVRMKSSTLCSSVWRKPVKEWKT